MHLKSLTLKGFKSFASATTLRLEPGITCVVGPNGSGKSNVVDAISWVLGEQGAKALRGGKMEDVIFAGTSGRAPLGRAEVTLTIDNSDGALPIDYSEVSITRRMFRDGAGEYEINGRHCRLLDIQELLSDSGIGREMHVIVGQGQLDSVLQSQAGGPPRLHRGGRGRPQAPQAQGEGAPQAGRDAGQPHPAHRPHRRAAPPAQAAGPAGGDRAAGAGRAVRAARRPAAAGRRRPRHAARRAGHARRPTRRAARARRAEVEEQLSAARVEQERLEAALAAGRAAAGRGAGHLVPAVRAGRAARRHRPAGPGAAAPPRRPAEERAPGRDPDELDAEADAIAEQEGELVEAVVEARRRSSDVAEERAEHERTLAAAERAHLAAVRALADRRAGLATLAGRAEALRSGAAATAGGDRAAVRRARRGAGAHRRGRSGAGARPRGARRPRRGADDRLAGASAAAAPRRRTRALAPGWPSWWRASARRSSSGRTGGRGSTRCRSGWPAATAPARCSGADGVLGAVSGAGHGGAGGPHRGRRGAGRAGRRAWPSVAGRGSRGLGCCAPRDAGRAALVVARPRVRKATLLHSPAGTWLS